MMGYVREAGSSPSTSLRVGMTDRKARAKAKEEADPCGMTTRKAKAKEEADSQRE